MTGKKGAVEEWFRKDGQVGEIDLSGFRVEALDGAAGRIEQVLYWSDASVPDYVVIDSGGWIFRHKSVLSFREVEEVDAESRCLRIRMSRKQIREAPEFLPCI